MALNRAALTTELGARAGRHLRAVGLTTNDDSGHLKEPLDDTLRALGVAYSGLAGATLDEAELDKFLAIGAVYALNVALEEGSRLADIAATNLGTSKKQSDIVGNLERALVRAESRVAMYGILSLNTAMGHGVYSIDSIEPEAVA